MLVEVEGFDDAAGHAPQRLVGARGAASPSPYADNRMMNLFDGIDIDGNGHISYAEWMSAFDRLDYSGKGVVSRKQWCLAGGNNEMFDAIAGGSKNFAVASRLDWTRAHR